MSWPETLDVIKLAGSAGIQFNAQADPESELAAVISFSERRLRRSYTASTGTRLFDGNFREYLVLPGFTAVSLVEFLETDGSVRETPDAESYRAYPENMDYKTALRRIAASGPNAGDPALVYDFEVPPDIALRGRYRRAVWPLGAQNVRVTATWADGADVPDDLRVAAMKLCVLRMMGAVVGTLTNGATEWEESGISKETWGDQPYSQTMRLWRDEIKDVYGDRRRKILIGRL